MDCCVVPWKRVVAGAWALSCVLLVVGSPVASAAAGPVALETPTLTQIRPCFARRGAIFRATLHGTDFSPESMVDLGPGITVSVIEITPTVITADLEIAIAAAVGTRSVRVTQPGGPETELVDGFAVVVALKGKLTSTTPVFPRTAVGMFSDRELKIKNTGKDPLTCCIGAINGPYTLRTSPGPFFLNPKESVLVTVRFSPTAPGPSPGTLQMWSDDARKPELMIRLKGRGK